MTRGVLGEFSFVESLEVSGVLWSTGLRVKCTLALSVTHFFLEGPVSATWSRSLVLVSPDTKKTLHRVTER